MITCIAAEVILSFLKVVDRHYLSPFVAGGEDVCGTVENRL